MHSKNGASIDSLISHVSVIFPRPLNPQFDNYRKRQISGVMHEDTHTQKKNGLYIRQLYKKIKVTKEL